LRLEIKGDTTLLDTSYSVFEAGRVLREETVVGSGKLWRQEVAYVSPEEIQNWTRLLFEARVMTPDPEEFRRHFPNGTPNVTHSVLYVLSVRGPITGQAAAEQRRAMLNPSYLAELAPAYDPARAMDDLHRLLESLFK
jgi:hypothetical protein